MAQCWYAQIVCAGVGVIDETHYMLITSNIENLFMDLNTNPFWSSGFESKDLSDPEAFEASVSWLIDDDLIIKTEAMEVITTIVTTAGGRSEQSGNPTVHVSYSFTPKMRERYHQWSIDNLGALAQEALVHIKPKSTGGITVLGPQRLSDIVGVSLKDMRAAYKELCEKDFLYTNGSSYRLCSKGVRAQQTLKTAMAV